MKIIYILLLIILSACSPQNAIQNEYIILYENFEEQILSTINFPKDMAQKTSMYGNFLTDFNNFILFRELDKQDQVFERLEESLSYYIPNALSLNDMTMTEKNEEIIISDQDGKEIISIKTLENDDKYLFIAVGTLDQELEQFYDKVYK